MIRKKDRLENPVTDKVLVFHRTSEETNKKTVLVKTIVHPNGFVAAAHVHPHQTKRFKIVENLVGLRVGEKKILATPNDIAVVPTSTPHRFWNTGNSVARFLCEVRPALRFESLIETMFTLAVEKKTNRKKMPNPLRLAIIAKTHFDTVRLPFPPAPLQRTTLELTAPLGKALKYRPTLAPNET